MSGVKCSAKEEHSRLNTHEGEHATIDFALTRMLPVPARGRLKTAPSEILLRCCPSIHVLTQFAFFASIRG